MDIQFYNFKDYGISVENTQKKVYPNTGGSSGMRGMEMVLVPCNYQFPRCVKYSLILLHNGKYLMFVLRPSSLLIVNLNKGSM